MERQRHSRITDARLAWVIFVACLAVYHGNMPFWTPFQADAVPAPYAAWSFVRHGTFDLRAYGDDLREYVGWVVVELPDGTWISKYPPGSTWAAVPLISLMAAIREQPPSPAVMRSWGKLVASTYAAGAAVLFYFACRAVAPPAAAVATVLFALGTSMWSIASQAMWAHGPATFWLCVALYALLVYGEESGRARCAIVGLAVGMAVATRPTTVVFAGATWAAIWWRLGWRAAWSAGAGAALPLGLYALYTISYFGPSLAGGYGAEATWWTAPLMRRLADLLVGTSRGLVVCSPALLLAPWGFGALLSSQRTLSAVRRSVIWAWAGAAVVTVVLYAKWYGRGGWSFGPRFLCETTPVLCLLFALAYARLTQAGRRLALALVGVSVIVHFLGVFGDHAGWYERHPQEEQEQSLSSLRDTHIEANARLLLEKVLHKLLVGPRDPP